MHHLLSDERLVTLPAQCINGFRMIQKLAYYFPKQHLNTPVFVTGTQGWFCLTEKGTF
jgi:hypothetical protein